MTTIAYKGGVIAFDSYISQGETVTDYNYNKCRTEKGVKFVFAGPTCDYQKIVDGYFGGDIDECNATAVIVDSGRVYQAAWGVNDGFWVDELDKPSAVGSGWHFALGAMDAGSNAVEAVKIACNRDVYSGGKVRKISVKKKTN